MIDATECVRAGRTKAASPLRVASLLPSTTEIACALGFRAELVGRSHECAGGRALCAETGAPSRWITLAELAAADPDAVVVLPCGFDLARTRRELPALAAQGEWRDLRAVREGRAFLADGQALMNRPGPRLVESLEVLAEILHPEEFAPRHRDRGWERA